MGTKEPIDPQVMIISSVHRWNDTRLLYREASTLSEQYRVEVDAEAPFASQQWGDIQIRGLKILPRWARPIHWITLGWRALTSPARVIHFHDPELIPLGLMLRMVGKEVIYDVHEDVPLDLLEKAWIPVYLRRIMVAVYRLWQALADRFLSAIITATEPIAAQFHNHRLTVIRNYPPVKILSSADAREPFRPGSRLALIYLGSISESRGVLEIIQACNYLPKSWDYRLSVVGASKPGSAYGQELLAAAAPFDGRVEFRGHLDFKEAVSALNAAHMGLVCTHPTPNDLVGQPLKLLEYLVAGLAVVLSDFPAWHQYVAGYPLYECVDPKNPAAIADGIITLASTLSTVDVRQARVEVQKMQRKYDWASQAELLSALYRSILPIGGN